MSRGLKHCRCSESLVRLQVTLYHPETGNVETRLLFDYEAFWVGLVRVSGPTSKFNASLKRELLDSLVKCMLRVITHLDLSYSYDTETSSSGKDVGGYKVRPFVD